MFFTRIYVLGSKQSVRRNAVTHPIKFLMKQQTANRVRSLRSSSDLSRGSDADDESWTTSVLEGGEVPVPTEETIRRSVAVVIVHRGTRPTYRARTLPAQSLCPRLPTQFIHRPSVHIRADAPLSTAVHYAHMTRLASNIVQSLSFAYRFRVAAALTTDNVQNSEGEQASDVESSLTCFALGESPRFY